MSGADSLKPPKPSPGDTAHLVASGILSIIPGAAELFRWFVVPPYEKRQQEWMEHVAAVLRDLEQDRAGSIQDLQSNEAFVSLVTQATIVAIRNHHQQKRSALRNALTNAALSSDPGEDSQLAFIRFIDELSPAHITLLRLISELEGDVSKVTSYEGLYALTSEHFVPGPSRDIFKMLCLELQARGLLAISADIDDFPGIYEASSLLLEATRNDLPRVRLSSVGRSFLSIIAERGQGAA
jgi:hypothetical protein